MAFHAATTVAVTGKKSRRRVSRTYGNALAEDNQNGSYLELKIATHVERAPAGRTAQF